MRKIANAGYSWRYVGLSTIKYLSLACSDAISGIAALSAMLVVKDTCPEVSD